MKRFIALLVVLGVCGLVGVGCQKAVDKKAAEPMGKMEQKLTPPPPPPAPAAAVPAAPAPAAPAAPAAAPAAPAPEAK